MNAVQNRGMHEMPKSEAIHQHHRHADGRKEMYGMHKFNDKSSSSTISSSTAMRADRDHRSNKSHSVASQIPGAIRIRGDWSEHLSSNGKVYFFNNKTKSSQWERPKDWSSSRAVDVKKDKSKSSGPHNKVSTKHSSDGSACSNAHHTALKQHKSYSDPKKLQHQHANRSRTNNETHGSKDRDYRTANSSTAKDRDYRDIDYRDTRLSNNIESRSQDRDYRSSAVHHDGKTNLQWQTSSQAMHLSSNQSTKKEYNGKNNSLPNETHYSRSNSRNDYKDKYSIDGREPKSSNSTPRSASDLNKGDTDIKTRLSTESTEGESSIANGDKDTTPSALVQTLSSVLNQAGNSTCDEKKDNTIEGNLKNALQMLLSVAAKNQQITGNNEESKPVEAETPEKEEPPTKRVRPSNPTDDHINNSSLISQNTEKVLSDLRGIFDERHILHIQGWPAEQLERQSTRLCDENHQFVVNHTSQLSASMKMARSQVRSAEIHSTLHEQRVLYIRQQIKDLEKSTTVAPFT